MGKPPTRTRILVRNGLLVVLALGAISALNEHIFEVRDQARLTVNETFCIVQGRHVRYHLTGAGLPGPTVVLINGSSASLEQWSLVQPVLGKFAPVISYDRGGTGFSDLSREHDAIAGADELDQLLHCPGISGPFVVVSFSSGGPLATVFAAMHLDIVKGIVYVDPVLSSAPGEKSLGRILWRPIVANPVKAFLGYTRLRRAMTTDGVPSTPESERWNAVILSSHHWLAGSLESMSLDRAARQADASLEAHPFADMPLGMLTTADPAEGKYARDLLQRLKDLASSSKRATFRPIHGVHSELLHDPAAVNAIVDLIQTIVGEVRAGAGAGAEPSK